MTTDLQSGHETVPDDDIQERVLKVIAVTKRLPRESVSPDSTFESLGIDSLDRLNILFDLESEFDIQINDEEAKQVETIPQMVDGVRQLVHAGAGGGAKPVAATTGQPATATAERSTVEAGSTSAGEPVAPETDATPVVDPAGPVH